MRVAVIPARGGSKRIPRKNINLFCGKPMIAWSIEAAIRSKCFERIIVSTDDEEIGQIARDWGADTPFIRPADLAQDNVTTIPVIRHATQWLIDNGSTPVEVCCIYATAPFLRHTDLERGLRSLQEAHCDYAFSVTRYAFPIQRAISITASGRTEMLHPQYLNTRSQDLAEAFHDAGQFYWGRASAWIAERPIFSLESVPVVLPIYRVHDIDTPEDWIRAELMFTRMSD
jgi:pseudaminic acid cytidylyltransferase